LSSAKFRLAISPEEKTLTSLQTSPPKDKDSGNEVIKISCKMKSVTNWPGATYFVLFSRHVQNKGLMN